MRDSTKNPNKKQKHPVLFNPKLWEQRRSKILEFLKGKDNKIVMDLGCYEGKVLNYLIPLNEELKHFKLIGVDPDLNKLKICRYACKPTIIDESSLRPTPLDIDLYLGSCTQYDPNLPKVDVIIFSEIIQHYHPEELEQINNTIFGGYRPQYVVVSTPNSEFNVLFENTNWGKTDQKFRDESHKFEWSRKEFSHWCEAICSEYGYIHELDGVGTTPRSIASDLGFCTQFSIFKLNPSFNNKYPTPKIGKYTKHASMGYPYYKIERSEQEIQENLLRILNALPDRGGKYSIDEVWKRLGIKQLFTNKSNFIQYLKDCPTIELGKSKFSLIKEESTEE